MRNEEMSGGSGESSPGFDAFYADCLWGAARLAHLLTGSASEAQDIAQDAMLAVRQRWTEIENPSAYLRATVVNLSRMAVRRWVRERRYANQRLATTVANPEYDETWHQLRRLPAQQRAVVVLRFYEDLSLAEIAHLLDTPMGTVKSTLHRALRNLKDVLP